MINCFGNWVNWMGVLNPAVDHQNHGFLRNSPGPTDVAEGRPGWDGPADLQRCQAEWRNGRMAKYLEKDPLKRVLKTSERDDQCSYCMLIA